MSINAGTKTSPNGLEFIAKWEGCVLKPYRDIAGLRTIGIGHLIKSGENFPDGVSITKERAYELLAGDVKLCEDAIVSKIKVKLNQNQFDALVSFGFNCGVGVYTSSEACKVLNAGDYYSVPEKLLAWSKVKINGVLQVNKGLYNRRKSEGELFAAPVSSGAVVSEGASPPPPVVQWTADTLKIAQTCLKALGLYTIKVDGLWGPGTSNALTRFAVANNLPMGDRLSECIPEQTFVRLRTVAGIK